MRLLFSLLAFIFLGFFLVYIARFASPKIDTVKIQLEEIPDLKVTDFFLDNMVWKLRGEIGYYDEETKIFDVDYPHCIIEKKNTYKFNSEFGRYYTETDLLRLEKKAKIYVKTYSFFLEMLNFNMKNFKFDSKGPVTIIINNLGKMKGYDLLGNVNTEIFRSYRTKGSLSGLEFFSNVSSFIFNEKKILLRDNPSIVDPNFNAKADNIVINYNNSDIKDIDFTGSVVFVFGDESKINKAISVTAKMKNKEEKLILYDKVEVDFKNGDKVNGKVVVIDIKTGDINIENIKGSLNIKELKVAE